MAHTHQTQTVGCMQSYAFQQSTGLSLHNDYICKQKFNVYTNQKRLMFTLSKKKERKCYPGRDSKPGAMASEAFTLSN